MRERRKRTRVNFNTTVQVKTPDKQVVSSESRDISLKGIFVYTSDTFSLETPCRVKIELSGSSSGCSFQMEGKVTRQEDDGFAIEFLSMEIDSLYHLRNLVMWNAPDPEAFMHECQEYPGFR